MDARVFVGYTKAGTELGLAMTKKLKAKVHAIPWQSAFDVGKSIFSEVLDKPYEYDFGVFVFSPQDFQKAPGRIFLSANLVFELGLFIGIKGRTRAFPVWPKGFELPSDLQGVIHPRFDPEIADHQASLKEASQQILTQIQKQSHEDCYFIMNKKTGHCLDVEDWGQRPGNRIIQWRYHGGNNQQWYMDRHDQQWFKISSGHSGLCLQVVDASMEDEAPIAQGLFKGLKHQQWSFVRGPERAYIIKARHSRKVLAVQEVGEHGRALVVQRTWEHGEDKLWWISQEASIC